jgi:hypothetical protein
MALDICFKGSNIGLERPYTSRRPDAGVIIHDGMIIAVGQDEVRVVTEPEGLSVVGYLWVVVVNHRAACQRVYVSGGMVMEK